MQWFTVHATVRLLHIHFNYNYNFSDVRFQQIHGVAMGAAFSPSLANVIMSVTLHNFLHTQAITPLLLVCYIVDVFILFNDRLLGLHDGS